MIVEHFLVLNVPAKYIKRLVSGLVGHLPDAGALLGGAGEKAAAQAVTGELLLVEARTGGASLDDQRDAVVAEAGRADLVVAAHASKHGAVVDVCDRKPIPQRLDRAVVRPGHPRDADDAALALLVGLRAPDDDPKTLIGEFEIRNIERDQL